MSDEERKLATIAKIVAINPIPGADNIEAATVRGWQVVVKKNQFKAGDLAIYYEIDSFLPVKSEFEFLRKSCYRKLSNGQEGFRLRTIRLRGQISQGLLTPLPDLRMKEGKNYFIQEGDDVTEELGVVKYEPPIPAQLAGKMAGNFPSFIPKTDEDRIQNLYRDWWRLSKKLIYVTEKLDGSSFTCYYRDGKFGVCSRNWELQEDGGDSFWEAANRLDLKSKLSALGKNIALQGELVGPGIQKNPYNLKERTVYFFTAYGIDSCGRYPVVELQNLLSELELFMVPIVRTLDCVPEENLIEKLMQVADGKSLLNPDAHREGIVVRCLQSGFSFKVISNNYLINEKEDG